MRRAGPRELSAAAMRRGGTFLNHRESHQREYCLALCFRLLRSRSQSIGELHPFILGSLFLDSSFCKLLSITSTVAFRQSSPANSTSNCILSSVIHKTFPVRSTCAISTIWSIIMVNQKIGRMASSVISTAGSFTSNGLSKRNILLITAIAVMPTATIMPCRILIRCIISLCKSWYSDRRAFM